MLHEKLVINRHWAWAPHAHLAMAFDETACPIAEFPMTEEYLLAPDWPGIYAID